MPAASAAEGVKSLALSCSNSPTPTSRNVQQPPPPSKSVPELSQSLLQHVEILEDLDCPVANAAQYPDLVSAGEQQAEALTSLANVLEAALEVNDSAEQPLPECSTAEARSCSRPTPFHGHRPPPIALQSYIQRIAVYAKCSPVCFVMAYCYMERLAQKDPLYKVTRLNVHRMLITGVMLAAKLTDDAYFKNAYYAKIGGISTKEANRLELKMLELLDFRLHVTAAQVHSILRHWHSTLRVSSHQHSSSSQQQPRRSKKRVSEDFAEIPRPSQRQLVPHAGGGAAEEGASGGGATAELPRAASHSVAQLVERVASVVAAEGQGVVAAAAADLTASCAKAAQLVESLSGSQHGSRRVSAA